MYNHQSVENKINGNSILGHLVQSLVYAKFDSE